MDLTSQLAAMHKTSKEHWDKVLARWKHRLWVLIDWILQVVLWLPCKAIKTSPLGDATISGTLTCSSGTSTCSSAFGGTEYNNAVG